MTEHPDLQPLDESTFETVLCVVAHPDDLEYGTAAAVDRWVRAGKTVTYLLATRGEAGIDTLPPEQAAPLREQEERDGAAQVGVDVVEFLDGFTDGVVDAKADAGNRWIFPDLVDEGHEPWQVARLLIVADPEPTHFVDVSEHFDAAVASLSAHDAYLAALGPDYPKPAELLGMILGGPSELVGVPYAVTGRLVGG